MQGASERDRKSLYQKTLNGYKHWGKGETKCHGNNEIKPNLFKARNN